MSFEEVGKVDNILYQLAMYDVSGGMLIVPKDADGAMEFQKKVANRFNYLKNLVRNGECTVEFLKSNILFKNGPFAQKPMSEEELVDKLIEDSTKPIKTNEPSINPIIDALMKKIMPSMSDSDRDAVVRESGLGYIVLDDQMAKDILYGADQKKLTGQITPEETDTTTTLPKKTKRKYGRKRKSN